MDQRARIRARRAHFIGSTLAVLGCSPASTHETVAVAPRDVSSAPPPASATVPEPDAGVAPPKDAGAPLPFSIPDGISAETRTRYERLGERVRSLKERQAKLAEELAKGPASWRDFAGQLEMLVQAAGWFGYYCPTPARPETDAFLKMVEDQRKQANARTEQIQKDAQKALGKNGVAELERYTQEFDAANPRPCLSIACDRW